MQPNRDTIDNMYLKGLEATNITTAKDDIKEESQGTPIIASTEANAIEESQETPTTGPKYGLSKPQRIKIRGTITHDNGG